MKKKQLDLITAFVSTTYIYYISLPPGGRHRIHPEKPVARARLFASFARKRALEVTQKYAVRWGRKRCKSGCIIKPRVDPRVSWPRIQDFQSRFRLPQECVEELTDEFESSPFRPGKGKHEKRGTPIPLFHKVSLRK